MPAVRFLTDVPGIAAMGAEMDLTIDQAAVWADGVRAELVTPERVVGGRRARRGVETR